jgi:hypothetical protein
VSPGRPAQGAAWAATRYCYSLEGWLQDALTRACSDSARRAQLLEAVRALKPACTSAEGFSVEALHAALQQRGYIVELKHTGDCAARSVGRRCLENLHHTYVVCRGSLAGAVTVGPPWLPPATLARIAAMTCGAVQASPGGDSAAALCRATAHARRCAALCA